MNEEPRQTIEELLISEIAATGRRFGPLPARLLDLDGYAWLQHDIEEAIIAYLALRSVFIRDHMGGMELAQSYVNEIAAKIAEKVSKTKAVYKDPELPGEQRSQRLQ